MGGFFQDAAGGLAYGSANDFDDADDPHRNVSRPGGRGAQLAERLLRAASLMADVPGC